jgi:hypothetical protein
MVFVQPEVATAWLSSSTSKALSKAAAKFVDDPGPVRGTHLSLSTTLHTTLHSIL